uniref:Late embryogenesis abundant protein LEA-2 subgroup domain-containing protein n=1 Tax=Leersia perrieri TaxID=77586 RepID=A0A0D9XVB0_9ORYZ
MASCFDECCTDDTQQIVKPCLVSSIIVIVAFTGIFVTISLAVTPQMKASVEDARLNAFAFIVEGGGNTTASFFNYNLSIALAVRNPNKAIGIKHAKPLLAVIAFHNRRLHSSTVVNKGYRQRPVKVKHIMLPIGGKISSDLLGDGAADDFKKQNATGPFNVELRLSGEITNHPFVIPRKREFGMSCPLSLQLAPPGPEVVVFHRVNCVADNPDKLYF